MLNIVKYHVKEEGLRYSEITGQVGISSRGQIVESFNQDKFGSVHNMDGEDFSGTFILSVSNIPNYINI